MTARTLTISTSPTIATGPWTDATTYAPDSIHYDPLAQEIRIVHDKPKATVNFSASTRVNKPTLVSKPLPEVMEQVKTKPLKQLFEKLETSKAVKITTSTSPSGAITFHANLELVQAGAKA